MWFLCHMDSSQLRIQKLAFVFEPVAKCFALVEIKARVFPHSNKVKNDLRGVVLFNNSGEPPVSG